MKPQKWELERAKMSLAVSGSLTFNTSLPTFNIHLHPHPHWDPISEQMQKLNKCVPMSLHMFQEQMLAQQSNQICVLGQCSLKDARLNAIRWQD